MSEWFALAARHLQVGDFDLAEEAFRRGVETVPQVPAAVWHNLALLRARQEDWPAAIADYQRALQAQPDLGPAWLGLGVAQMSVGDFPAAAAALQRAIALAEDPADAWLSLGNLYHLQERGAEARAAWAQAGDRPAVWLNLGNRCLAENDPEGALAWFDQVLAATASPEAALGRAIARLTLGDWEQGWRDFGVRWTARGCPYGGPVWDGQPLAGRRLLVVCEQGFGDSLQFVRYVRDLPQDGSVVLRCPEPLQRWFGLAFPEISVQAETEPLPPYDSWVSLMDLPLFFGVKGEVPYLPAPTAPRLPGEGSPLRLGLVARSGQPTEPYGQRQHRLKSVPWSLLQPLAQLPGVQGYALQKEGGAPPELIDLGPLLTDFAATAAVVSQLDAVVTVDTAIAHVAGALGKPVWILLPFAADWRWLRDRADSPWYPTAVLCRQPAPGDWTGAIAVLQKSLYVYLAQRLDERARQVWGQGDSRAAVADWKAAVQMQPTTAYLRFNWALALQKQGEIGGAIALYRDAWRLEPSPATAIRLGTLLTQVGQSPAPLYQQALTQFPDSDPLHNHLANVCLEQGEAKAAETHARRAIALQPTATAWHRLGLALGQQQRLTEAEAAFQQALTLDPGLAQAHLNLGCLYQEQNALERAIAAFRRGLALVREEPLVPGCLRAQAQFHLACALLAMGHYQEGWVAYEARWYQAGGSLPPQPFWQGEPVASLLVWGEQGFGDVLQFVRFVPRVRSRCQRLYLAVPPALCSLLADSFGPADISIVALPGPLPRTTAQIPLLSLPRLLQTTLNTLPAEVPYLRAAPIAPLPPGPHFGVVWQSSAPNVAGLQPSKSCGWERLAPLTQALPTVRFCSLQVGVPAPPELLDLAAHCQDFRDTAAYLTQLDGLITVDTAIAHLAGALAKPTWVLLPYAADWPWGLDRSDSPWYRTLRLLRQPRRGDWDTPIQTAIAQIREFYGL